MRLLETPTSQFYLSTTPLALESVDPNTEAYTYMEEYLIIHIRIPGALILHSGVLNTHGDHLL
jgi:hypothetical protein